jgi:hypothetical protein
MKNPPAHARGVGWWVTELLAAFAGFHTLADVTLKRMRRTWSASCAVNLVK